MNELGYLFSDSLEGYTAGYIMVECIDKVYGRDTLKNCLCDCFEFINYYNQSLDFINSELHKIVLFSSNC
jgi:hypothetical protein